MEISNETATIAASLVGSAIMVGIAWGASQATVTALKEKVSDLQKDFDTHCEDDKNIHERFVTQEVFASVISPIHNQLQSIQTDIKDLIKLVSKSQARRE